ncbi:hypothetical protein CONPUDRAFT_135279 [Coniophora puteana RWD-64-598 SS2]|uniref:Zinc finger PHD-type domain-containing protein n=1 Tax=Coniophora puteana (strain RWD-64-598) TaxID=741705 RepID=A0A5M3N2I3_CONPW|nr:uncharacterized protein CONPUDRAFT_135279 [Coniophora puteana RWD-64-598 SS2]EIW85600.1 hypothetical protein CONPUDRAFT_135279 [Coniophora puteana RWD-64-598 SS2]
MIEHVGVHILLDDGLDCTVELCGFCMQPAAKSGCVFYLRPTKGSAAATFQVDLTRSSCPNLIYFSYHSAATTSDSTPCSNVPIACPICSPTNKLAIRNPAVWRYLMVAHLRIHHASSQLLPPLVEKFEVPQEEITKMETFVWQKRFIKSRKSRKAYQTLTIAVSDAHRTSQLALNASEDDHEGLALADEQGPSDGVHPDSVNVVDGAVNDHDSNVVSDVEDEPAVHEDSLDAPESVENDVVTRAGWKSRKRDLNAMLRVCDCDKVVTPKEISDGVAIRCKYNRCKTGWFHLTCMYLDHVVSDWRCQSHERPIKKAKRGGKK